MRSSSAVPGAVLVIAAGVLWGTTGTAQALGPDDTSALGVGATRLAVAAAALGGVALVRGGAGWRSVRGLALAGASLGMAAYQPFFFAAVRSTGVAVGTVVAIGSAPVIAGLLAWWLRRERPGAGWAAATALALGGCALLAVAGDPADVDPGGVGLALGAGASYALYAVATKGLLDRADAVSAAGWTFAIAAIVLAPLLLTEDVSWLATGRGALMAAHLGLVATAAAYLLFTSALDRITVATAATLTLAEPATAAALGIAVLGERPEAAALAGMALIVAGLVVASLGPGRARAPA